MRRSGGRLETQAYLREVFRSEGKLGSRYDSNVTSWDPFPFSPTQLNNDPILDSASQLALRADAQKMYADH